MKTELLVLKSKVCGLEHSSHKFRRRIAKSKGDRKWKLQFRKAVLGSFTREHLIAYGLLRGVPYEKIEGKCATGNEPNVFRVSDIIRAHVPSYEQKQWSTERVTDLLKRGS